MDTHGHRQAGYRAFFRALLNGRLLTARRRLPRKAIERKKQAALRSPPPMTHHIENQFSSAFQLIWLDNAEYFASELFFDSFKSPFPRPTPISFGGREIPREGWFQCVAFYKWPNGLIEPVGFCNWIRFGDVYLEGGLCVRGNFYKRLPREHWRECQTHGGVAQLMMEFGAARLNDLPAWFGYCGDKRSLIVTQRVGYQRTAHPYLIAKWFRSLPDSEKEQIVADVSRIGPF